MKNFIRAHCCILFATASAFVFADLAHAQYAVDRFVVAGGGGGSSGGNYSISGTVGQADAGRHFGGQFMMEGGFWSGITLVQTPGAPLLILRREGPNVVIAWPRETTGFNLEETTAVDSANWNTPVQPVVDTATEHTVTVPASESLRFYRLRQP